MVPLPRAILLTFCGLFLVVCSQGGQTPVAPSGGLEAASACKDATFNADVVVYEDASTQNGKLKDCKYILSASLVDAETRMNQLLAALYTDWTNCPTLSASSCILQVAPSDEGLARSVADFAGAICGLRPALGADECLVPTASNVENGEWIATTASEGDIVLLPNLTFGVQIVDLVNDGAQISVAIRQNLVTSLGGPCPDGDWTAETEPDCDNVTTSVDIDPNVPNPFNENGLYVEACESDAVVFTELASCSGDACAYGEQVDPPTGIGLQCTVGALFSGTSVFFAADDEPRTRNILARVNESTYAGGSAGTQVTAFEAGTTNIVGQCETALTGDPDDGNATECRIPVFVPDPDGACFDVKFEKTFGNGAFNALREDECLTATDPPYTDPDHLVVVDLVAPGQ